MRWWQRRGEEGPRASASEVIITTAAAAVGAPGEPGAGHVLPVPCQVSLMTTLARVNPRSTPFYSSSPAQDRPWDPVQACFLHPCALESPSLGHTPSHPHLPHVMRPWLPRQTGL